MSRMTTLPGEIVRVGDESRLRFDRVFRSDIEDVWSAITTPERCRRWLGDPRLTGGKGRLVMGDGDDEWAALEVRECVPPRLIDTDWAFPDSPPTRLRVTLAEDGPDRTRVIMEHTFPAGFPITRLPGYATGWHHFVDCLDAFLAGEELPDFGDYYPALLDDWRAAVPR